MQCGNLEKNRKIYIMETQKKNPYLPPLILREVAMYTEGALLAGSVVDKATVTSVGQEVNDLDWSAEGFNHTWEE